MERNRSLEVQQVKLLRVELLYKNGMSIANSCKMVGISVHTFYKWCANSTSGARENGGFTGIAAGDEQTASSLN